MSFKEPGDLLLRDRSTGRPRPEIRRISFENSRILRIHNKKATPNPSRGGLIVLVPQGK